MIERHLSGFGGVNKMGLKLNCWLSLKLRWSGRNKLGSGRIWKNRKESGVYSYWEGKIFSLALSYTRWSQKIGIQPWKSRSYSFFNSASAKFAANLPFTLIRRTSWSWPVNIVQRRDKRNKLIAFDITRGSWAFARNVE